MSTRGSIRCGLINVSPPSFGASTTRPHDRYPPGRPVSDRAPAWRGRIADEDPIPQAIYIWNGQIAWHALDLDRIEEAAEAAERVADVLDIDPTMALGPPFLAVPEALGRAGRRERCEQVCAVGDDQGKRAGSRLPPLGSALGRAALAMHDGEVGRAVQLLQDAMPYVEADFGVPKARFLRRLGWAYKARGQEGDRERARAVLEECLDLLKQMGDRRTAGLVSTELEALDR